MKRFALLGMMCLVLLTACMGDDNGAESDEGFVETVTEVATSSTAPAAATDASIAASPTSESTIESATATSTPTEEFATPDTAAATEPVGTPAGEADIQATIDEIEQAVADLRGLEVQQDVPAEIISREQLRENLTQLLAEEYSQEEADQDTLEMWLLRLIDDPTLDLYQFQLDLLSERVLGYYDTDEDELFVISDVDGLSATGEMTMAHEFTHALQDQYYDFDRLLPEDSDDSDRDLAVSSLTEGDAEVTSTLYLLEHMDATAIGEIMAESQAFPSDVIDQAPPYIRESLYFPYQQGAEFVTGLYQSGGFDAIDATYADPPASSEQILHPEKYTGERDAPQQVELPDLGAALGAGWEETDTDTLGEFDLRIMLRENGATTYEEAAAGWGGARFDLYRNGDDALLALKTVWDSEPDAAEFEQAMRETLGTTTVAENVWDIGQGRFLGMKTTDGVWVVTGTTQAAVEQALSAISR